MRILIVEDDPVSAEVLSGLLSPYGDSEVAVDGEQGFTMYQKSLSEEEPFSLICLDIMLPKMDGQAVLQEIRSTEEAQGIIKEAAAKIIMTTALSDMESVLRAVENNCTGYLVKPIMEEDLLTQLEKLGYTPPAA